MQNMMTKKYWVLFFSALGIVLLSSSSWAKDQITIQFHRDARLLGQAQAEVADTPPTRAQGLMFRKAIGENEGMWFVYDRDISHPFWMKNTYLSLDLIFIDSQGRIVSLIENAKPLSEERLSPEAIYRYVLEMNAGWAKKHTLKKGDRASF